MLVMLKTLGDVVLATTLVHELKVEYPDAEIHIYTNKLYAGIFDGNQDVFEVHAPDDWNYNSLFIEMAAKGYDRVFAPYQVRPECNMWHQDPHTRNQHLVDFYWHRMGMHRPITDRECYLYPSEADQKAADAFISTDVPRVAVHSTTGVETKDWPHFDALTEELRKAGYGVVQIGARSDKGVKGAVDLRGKLSFTELGAFLTKCAAFVGLDSGLSYIADAVKTPTIVIQGSTDPKTSGPISARVVHLFAEKTGYEDCQTIRCHVNCRHERNCINEITVDMVLDRLEPTLQAWKKPIPAGI